MIFIRMRILMVLGGWLNMSLGGGGGTAILLIFVIPCVLNIIWMYSVRRNERRSADAAAQAEHDRFRSAVALGVNDVINARQRSPQAAAPGPSRYDADPAAYQPMDDGRADWAWRAPPAGRRDPPPLRTGPAPDDDTPSPPLRLAAPTQRRITWNSE